MSLFPVTAALDEFSAGVLFITFVTVVLLALGGVVVIVYLLMPPVRRGLDRWMARQEEDIWTETLAFVDAQTEVYRRGRRQDLQRRRAAAAQRVPAFKPEVPAWPHAAQDQPQRELVQVTIHTR